MRFPKLGRRDKDFTRLEYNDYVTLTSIPAQAQGYSISGRSPLEWIIDRYHVKTDKAFGIVNDPNDFLREQGRPDAVVDLIKRLVRCAPRSSWRCCRLLRFPNSRARVIPTEKHCARELSISRQSRAHVLAVLPSRIRVGVDRSLNVVEQQVRDLNLHDLHIRHVV